MAAVLALVCLLLLAAVRIGGLTERHAMRLLQGEGTALTASAEVGIVLTLIFQHEVMSVVAAERPVAHRPEAVLQILGLRQLEACVLPHLAMTGGALALNAMLHSRFQLHDIEPP